jgi:predicted nucleotide-binding protein (sugar kinase/HSP70/actin superfamily)
LDRLEATARNDLSLAPALWEVVSGRLFGVTKILQQAGQKFANLRGLEELPVVELTGEIYVRGVDFSNDMLIEKLEARGLRVHLASKAEWVNYCGNYTAQTVDRNLIASSLSRFIRQQIEKTAFSAMSGPMAWQPLPTTETILQTAEPYVTSKLAGEAVLAVGAPLHEWRHGQIDAVINVGPLECMPSKIAEAQYHHVAEREGLLSLTLNFNGDPVNTATLDNFMYEVKSRFKKRRQINRGKVEPCTVV